MSNFSKYSTTNLPRFTVSALFDNWCISCRHWADFFLTLLTGDKTELTKDLVLDAVQNFGTFS